MSATLVLALCLPATTAQHGLDSSRICAPGIADQSQPAACIGAASIPTPGTLLPLGPYFWVGAAGEVGIGTQTPGALLQVAGDSILDGRLAVGNSAVLDGLGAWSWEVDMSTRIDQFPGTYRVGLFSDVTYAPPIDLIGLDAGWLWSHVFHALVEDGNDRDIEALFGATSHAFPRGSGTVTYVLGTGAVAENDTGHVVDQAGGAFSSYGDHDSTIGINTWVYASGGHYGTGGSIETNYGVYVETPWNTSPLQNNYGLYLADQDVGVDDSFAIYAAGGTTYLAGDLGVGTQTPAAKLDIDGDFAATGTKSFRQEHPADPTREIWFVCLEGNEAGTYFRGTSQLRGGRALIPVPEDFALVTEQDGLTVQLTALGDARVWVERKGLDQIVVHGSADVEFDYLVNGVRAGHADFETLRSKPIQTLQAPTGRSERFPLRVPERQLPR